MRWSVVLRAAGDRELTIDEIVELADAVAPLGGVASGIGATAYGAQLLVSADDETTAARIAGDAFVAAAGRAGLPAWPAEVLDVVSEAEDDLEAELGTGRYQ